MDVDPIGRIYSHAALRTIAARLPEEHGDLALILALLGEDLQHCGEAWTTPPAQPPAPPRATEQGQGRATARRGPAVVPPSPSLKITP